MEAYKMYEEIMVDTLKKKIEEEWNKDSEASKSDKYESISKERLII